MVLCSEPHTYHGAEIVAVCRCVNLALEELAHDLPIHSNLVCYEQRSDAYEAEMIECGLEALDRLCMEENQSTTHTLWWTQVQSHNPTCESSHWSTVRVLKSHETLRWKGALLRSPAFMAGVAGVMTLSTAVQYRDACD